jgi:hypothetical protein
MWMPTHHDVEVAGEFRLRRSKRKAPATPVR